MKIVVPLAAVVLALASCSNQGQPASHSARVMPSTPMTVTPRPQDAGAATASPYALDLWFSGTVAGRITEAQVGGSLCGPPNSRIETIVRGRVGGEPVTLAVIVNNVETGDSQALVVMSPPPGTIAPSSPGVFGDDGSTWSSFAGHAIIQPDGRSATISADLGHASSPVVEHVEGGWKCPSVAAAAS